MNQIRVVAGVNILDVGGQPHVLLGLKSTGNWEFPGGKVEVGESDEVALQREWIEELNTNVTVGTKIGSLDSNIYDVNFYHVGGLDQDTDTVPQLIEHIEVRYHPLSKTMDDLTMNNTNRAILEQLYDEYGDI